MAATTTGIHIPQHDDNVRHHRRDTCRNDCHWGTAIDRHGRLEQKPLPVVKLPRVRITLHCTAPMGRVWGGLGPLYAKWSWMESDLRAASRVISEKRPLSMWTTITCGTRQWSLSARLWLGGTTPLGLVYGASLRWGRLRSSVPGGLLRWTWDTAWGRGRSQRMQLCAALKRGPYNIHCGRRLTLNSTGCWRMV